MARENTKQKQRNPAKSKPTVTLRPHSCAQRLLPRTAASNLPQLTPLQMTSSYIKGTSSCQNKVSDFSYIGQLLMKTDYANINKSKEGRELGGLPLLKFILSTEAGTEMTSSLWSRTGKAHPPRPRRLHQRKTEKQIKEFDFWAKCLRQRIGSTKS